MSTLGWKKRIIISLDSCVYIVPGTAANVWSPAANLIPRVLQSKREKKLSVSKEIRRLKKGIFIHLDLHTMAKPLAALQNVRLGTCSNPLAPKTKR